MQPSAIVTDRPAAWRRAGKPLVLSLLLIGLALALPAGASAFRFGGSGWFEQTSGTTHLLMAVDFGDAAHGWAVGFYGTILATSNGGLTWSAQSSGTAEDLYGVAFTDATHGWAVGGPFVGPGPDVGRGVILATTNGGATWSEQTSGTTHLLMAVDFGDAAHGWAVGFYGTILATTNAGATWSTQSSGTTEALFAVAFGDATHGWAVGDNGVILATSNGGATWSAQSSGSGADLTGVTFIDATHGWVVGDLGIILATTDGGTTWSKQASRTTADLTGVASSDGSHVWAVSISEMILATADGGATWGAQSPVGNRNLFGVDFTDAAHGWAVGGATILATTDGGGPCVKPGYKMAPPDVPSRVRAGARVKAYGDVWPGLPARGRVKIFWEHFIGGRWDMALALKPAVTYAPFNGGTYYFVRIVFKPGAWRVHAAAMAGREKLATSAVRRFTVY